MNNEFKNVFLVCLDYGDDLNHVVSRTPSLKKARHAANLAKERWPDKGVYITVEKLLDQNLLEGPQTPPTSPGPSGTICICGANEGGCLSNLSCRCPAIASCKQVPLNMGPYAYGEQTQQMGELDPAEINIVSIRRGIIEVVIPDWNPEETIGLSPDEIPRDILPQLEPGVILEADINLEAESSEDLSLQNIRLVYEDEEEETSEEPADFNI